MAERLMEEVNYCPKCGNTLTRWNNERKHYICSQKHLWDIWQDFLGEWKFRAIKWGSCRLCGGVFPSFELTFASKLCSECGRREKENWRMDSEKSYALLQITPVVTSEARYYSCNTRIEIRPYPSPLSYGGMYGFARANDDEELLDVIRNFEAEANKLRSYGMTRVDTRTEGERQIASQMVLFKGG